MVQVVRSTVIDAPIETVWAQLRDFNGHDRWHPAVAESHLEGFRDSDMVGAVRNFRLESGERLREQLIAMSDKDYSFSYAIVESEVPLYDYVAHVTLKPVTDGGGTFWSWQSRFNTPDGRQDELAALVASGVYEAGFDALRQSVCSTTTFGEPSLVKNAQGIAGKAMALQRYGGVEQMTLQDIAAPSPGPGQVRIQHTAIGVNFIDIYCRTGAFQMLQPPGVLGMEAAGTVVDVGPGVSHLHAGDRVGYACPPTGAYSTIRTMDADLVLRLPATLSNEEAAAGLLKGNTVSFLLNEVQPVNRGDFVLVYAPAGGVGRMLCQWANALGAHVIAATSSEKKAGIARACGALDVILPGSSSLSKQVMTITGGHGADVIFDAVGQDSFAQSVEALAICGHLVSYGQASGPVGAHDIGVLASKSATISRPNYAHYTDTPAKLRTVSDRFFEMQRRGIVSINIGQRFTLSQVGDAHSAIENRETTGSTILSMEDLS